MDELFSNNMEDAISERQNEPPVIAGFEGEISTRIAYSLRFTGWPNLSQLVAIAVATATYTVLSYLSLTYIPTPIKGLGTIFFPIIFGLPFALWFGGWALVIAYIGNTIGAGIMLGTPPLQSVAFGVADLIQLCIPMLLYRLLAPRFGLSPIGKDVLTGPGFIFFALVAVLPWNIIGGLYGTILIIAFGAPPDAFLLTWVTWFLSNIVLLLIGGSVVLSQMGPIIERSGLTVRDLFR